MGTILCKHKIFELKTDSHIHTQSGDDYIIFSFQLTPFTKFERFTVTSILSDCCPEKIFLNLKKTAKVTGIEHVVNFKNIKYKNIYLE